jgi:hypothetical protein
MNTATERSERSSAFSIAAPLRGASPAVRMIVCQQMLGGKIFHIRNDAVQ